MPLAVVPARCCAISFASLNCAKPLSARRTLAPERSMTERRMRRFSASRPRWRTWQGLGTWLRSTFRKASVRASDTALKLGASVGGANEKPALQRAYVGVVQATGSSFTCQGRPRLLSSSMNGSGFISSMFQTPGLSHWPPASIAPPMAAGTPVV